MNSQNSNVLYISLLHTALVENRPASHWPLPHKLRQPGLCLYLCASPEHNATKSPLCNGRTRLSMGWAGADRAELCHKQHSYITDFGQILSHYHCQL